MRFERSSEGRTFLSNQFATYPFHVCKPQYFDEESLGMATLYTQSCSGGIFSKDNLKVNVTAGRDARVHLTTQASTIIHKGTYGVARQEVVISAEKSAYVEYLPDSAILFSGAGFHSRIRINAHPESVVFVADSFLCHEPYGPEQDAIDYMGEVVLQDDEGELLAIDRIRATKGSMTSNAIGIAGGYPVHGAVMIHCRNPDLDQLVDVLRQGVEETTDAYLSASKLPHDAGVWCRILAADGADMKDAMQNLWFASRQFITGVPPVPRRK